MTPDNKEDIINISLSYILVALFLIFILSFTLYFLINFKNLKDFKNGKQIRDILNDLNLNKKVSIYFYLQFILTRVCFTLLVILIPEEYAFIQA